MLFFNCVKFGKNRSVHLGVCLKIRKYIWSFETVVSVCSFVVRYLWRISSKAGSKYVVVFWLRSCKVYKALIVEF